VRAGLSLSGPAFRLDSFDVAAAKFIAAPVFEGAKAGYYFGTTSHQGTGYYVDARGGAWLSSAAAPAAQRRSREADRDEDRCRRVERDEDRCRRVVRDRSRERGRDYRDDRRRGASEERPPSKEPPQMSKEQREKAAMERLVAKRAQGSGGPRHGFR
jgi:hypothetical protein